MHHESELDYIAIKVRDNTRICPIYHVRYQGIWAKGSAALLPVNY